MFAYRVVIGIIFASLCTWTSQASAGWVIDQETKGMGNRQQVLIQNNQMKILHLGKDGKPENAVIINAGAQTFTQINYKERQYIATSVQEYAQMLKGAREALAPKMKEAMKKMQEAMKNMPPEQRKMMEQQMQAQMGNLLTNPQDCPEPPKIDVRKTDQKDTIAGYSAVRYDLLADGKLQSELWIAKDITAWQDLDPKKLQQFSAEMAKVAPCASGKGQRGPFGNDATWKVMSEGYPVKTVTHGGMEATIEVVKAEQKTVPAAEFQPPAGFDQKTLPNVKKPEAPADAT